MEFSEVLKKRRMIRNFKKEPLPDEVLHRLIHAGLRAPTGSNIPYRRMMIVKDPALLDLIQAVAPGYMEGTPSALIVIYTDLNISNASGKAHGFWYSRIDAGVAAENIHLAAVDMGLGSSFFTSMSVEGLKEILCMPEYCRPEIVIRVGYPADILPRPRKSPAQMKLVYVNRYGQEWNHGNANRRE